MTLANYVCETIWHLVEDRSLVLCRRRSVHLSQPCTCNECRARVRMVGSPGPDGAWHCPVCGSAYPYVFWKIRTAATRPVSIDELVLELHPNACSVCGEGRPPCRCERRRAGERTTSRDAERRSGAPERPAPGSSLEMR